MPGTHDTNLESGIAAYIRFHEEQLAADIPAPPYEWQNIVALAAGSAPGISLRDIGIWTLLFCATVVVYWPVLHGGLLWDDSGHLTRPELQSLHGLWRIWFQLGSSQQYYPLLHSAFWIEHWIWGDQVLGYHLINVALHGISACLLMRIVRHLSLPGAWLAGFVFALHPVCVEAVARTDSDARRSLQLDESCELRQSSRRVIVAVLRTDLGVLNSYLTSGGLLGVATYGQNAGLARDLQIGGPRVLQLQLRVTF